MGGVSFFAPHYHHSTARIAFANQFVPHPYRYLPRFSPFFNSKYLSLYFILGLVSIGIQLLRSSLLILGSIRASRLLARQLLEKMVRQPMSFFDSQPTGGVWGTADGSVGKGSGEVLGV